MVSPSVDIEVWVEHSDVDGLLDSPDWSGHLPSQGSVYSPWRPGGVASHQGAGIVTP